MSQSSQESQKSSSSNRSKDSKKRLYVAAIPADFSLHQLRARMEEFGKIADLRLYEKTAKKFGFVEFEKPAEAAKAIAYYLEEPRTPALALSYARNKQSERTDKRADRKRQLAKELIQLAAEDLLSPQRKKRK